MSKDVSTPYTYTINDLVVMYILLDYYKRKKESEGEIVIKVNSRKSNKNQMYSHIRKDLEDNWCAFCQNHLKELNACNGCQGVVDPLYPKKSNPPSKFKPIIKEEKRMIVTIIGSLSKREQINECKEYWERFGHKVNSPCDNGRESMSLIELQASWIEKIEAADLVVAIPKEISIQGHGASTYVHEFGESTSYEMAIALRFDKKIVIW